MLGLAKGLERSSTKAVLSSMCSLPIILLNPVIDIGLEFFKRSIELFAKSRLVKLFQDGAMEALAAFLCPSALCFSMPDTAPLSEVAIHYP